MIEFTDYDPRWAQEFDRLRRIYADAMLVAAVPVGIEHVGSTSVPGLAAKPIIDIDIIADEVDVAAATTVLIELGFDPCGDLGIPQRYAFAQPDGFGATNTYVVVAGSLALRNHLAIRELLRSEPAWRETYAATKRLAAAATDDLGDYGRAKNDTVQAMLFAAGFTAEELESINAANLAP